MIINKVPAEIAKQYRKKYAFPIRRATAPSQIPPTIGEVAGIVDALMLRTFSIVVNAELGEERISKLSDLKLAQAMTEWHSDCMASLEIHIDRLLK